MLLLADPIILLSPDGDATADDWIKYHDYLVSCDEVRSVGKHEIIFSELCYDELLLSDRYPKRPRDLQEKLKAAGVVDIDARMLIMKIKTLVDGRNEKLLERLEIEYDDKDEEYFEISKASKFVLICKSTINIDPESILNRLNLELMQALKLTLATMVYASKVIGLIQENEYSILTVDPDPEKIVSGIHISAEISTDSTDSTQLTSMDAVVTPRNLLQIDVIDLYPDIEKMFRHYCDREGHNFQEIKFTIAESFRSSMDDLHVTKAKEEEILKIFGGLVRVLQDQLQPVATPPKFKSDNHPLLRKKNSEERILDPNDSNWQAWRAHLSGKVYRLHYWWHSQTRYFIFSAVKSQHNDFTIPRNEIEKNALTYT